MRPQDTKIILTRGILALIDLQPSEIAEGVDLSRPYVTQILKGDRSNRESCERVADYIAEKFKEAFLGESETRSNSAAAIKG